MKKLLFHTLLKSYSVLVVGIVIFFAGVLSYISWFQFDSNRLRLQQEVADVLKIELDDIQGRVGNYLADSVSDTKRLEGFYRYFQETPADYQTWLLEDAQFGVKDLALQDSIRTLYLYYPFIKGVDIAPVNADSVFVSTSDSKSGKKVFASNYKAPAQSISMTLFSPSSSEGMASVYLTLDQESLESLIAGRSDFPVSVVVQDSLNRILYQQGSMSDTLPLTKRSSSDLRITVGVEKVTVFQELGVLVFIIFLGSFCLVTLLLFVLRRVFKQYELQVVDLVTTIQDIGSDQEDLRIQTEGKQQEMLVIAQAINQMLDSRDQSMQDVYRLQLAQKDANMRALQAQINPHFLYNTLEFFRMYAVTKQVGELGDMIYEFSTLLRRSVSQAKTTTLAEEVSFCEKHSYICQIRYPKSIAYAFQVDPACEVVEIPRFVLQPLIENYFAHGVDLKRTNNAISLKASKMGQDMEIRIEDNGKGMRPEILERYKDLLQRRELSQESRLKSIGILNVHERLLLYFGQRYQMDLESEQGQGTRFVIKLQEVFEEGGEIHEKNDGR